MSCWLQRDDSVFSSSQQPVFEIAEAFGLASGQWRAGGAKPVAYTQDRQGVIRLSDREKIDVGRFPPFGFRSTSHAQLTPDERPNLTDGIISTAWNAGTLHVQYVGIENVAKEAVNTVSKAMWRFAIECQIMVVLYAGVLLSRETIQSQIGSGGNRDKPFAISTTDKDGKVSGIWAWLPTGAVFDAFSAGGEFETTFAKSFVVSSYQMWEEVTRPKIAQALGTSHNEIRSDLMGEWRHLRNWLVHPSEETEETYFKNANLLARIPGGPAPGKVPKIRSGMVLPMMGYLNHLEVIVNPAGLSPAIEISSIDPELAEQVSRQKESGEVLVPIWQGFEPPGA